ARPLVAGLAVGAGDDLVVLHLVAGRAGVRRTLHVQLGVAVGLGGTATLNEVGTARAEHPQPAPQPNEQRPLQCGTFTSDHAVLLGSRARPAQGSAWSLSDSRDEGQ